MANQAPLDSIGLVGRAVAANIAILRMNKGLSIAELSRQTGGQISELALRRIESLGRRVDVDDLTLLADALQVSVNEILPALDYAEMTPSEALVILKRAASGVAVPRRLHERAIKLFEAAAED